MTYQVLALAGLRCSKTQRLHRNVERHARYCKSRYEFQLPCALSRAASVPAEAVRLSTWKSVGAWGGFLRSVASSRLKSERLDHVRLRLYSRRCEQVIGALHVVNASSNGWLQRFRSNHARATSRQICCKTYPRSFRLSH